MRRPILRFMVFFVLGIALSYTASAVTKITPTGIETWLVAAVPDTGAANVEGIETDWLLKHAGISEADLSDPAKGPEEGDKIGNIDPMFAWKVVKGDPANNFIIDFQAASVYGKDIDNITAYMYLYVTSDKDRKVTIYGGSDDALAIFVNGKQVWKNPALRGVGPNQDKVEVELKAGKNGILFKVCEQGGGWGGWGRIEPIEGLKVSTSKKVEGDPIPAPLVVNIFFDEWLHLMGPNLKPDAAIDAGHNVDLIAEWSGKQFTEEGVASGKGVARGVKVGTESWTEGKITDWGSNNLQTVAQQIFGKQGDQNNVTWYGYTIILSPDERDVKLRFGSDDSVKAWLNGVVIHDNPVLRGASGFIDTVKVHLKKGPNILLVKVCEQGGGWSGFVGFDNEADFAGLTVDSSLTPVSWAGKAISKWGDIKR